MNQFKNSFERNKLIKMKYAIVNGKIFTVDKKETVIENGTILIKDGKIEAQGTLDVLLRSSSEFQRLWRGDLGKTGTG